MRQRIQRSMIFVVTTTLVFSYCLLIFIIYQHSVEIVTEEVRQETSYICEAIKISGTGYVEQMDAVQRETRVTWIAQDGSVLYDSVQDQHSLENHSGRAEVKEAVKNGIGEDIRWSDTVGEKMYYYAQRLSDGTVLRASKMLDSAWQLALEILPVMILIAAIMIGVAWILSKWQVSRLIHPINQLDLEHPLEQEFYPELHTLLERIENSNREKEAVANMRKEFSANVSHELKTPLTSISGYAEIMKNGLVRGEDMREFSERIYNEASRLIVLVEDIIKLSRLDEERIEIEKENVNLYFLTREIVSRLMPQAEKQSVDLEMSGEPFCYWGIRQILDEMIYNLVENAIKYNQPGGKVRVWVGETLEGGKILVSDTGIGIPKNQQERIFERFYRVDKSHSKARGGTGLGLSIVKHGAILHGIDIRVESEPGQGTQMELDFHTEDCV